jgi:hypothetical protein
MDNEPQAAAEIITPAFATLDEAKQALSSENVGPLAAWADQEFAKLSEKRRQSELTFQENERQVQLMELIQSIQGIQDWQFDLDSRARSSAAPDPTHQQEIENGLIFNRQNAEKQLGYLFR